MSPLIETLINKVYLIDHKQFFIEMKWKSSFLKVDDYYHRRLFDLKKKQLVTSCWNSWECSWWTQGWRRIQTGSSAWVGRSWRASLVDEELVGSRHFKYRNIGGIFNSPSRQSGQFLSEWTRRLNTSISQFTIKTRLSRRLRCTHPRRLRRYWEFHWIQGDPRRHWNCQKWLARVIGINCRKKTKTNNQVVTI